MSEAVPVRPHPRAPAPGPRQLLLAELERAARAAGPGQLAAASVPLSQAPRTLPPGTTLAWENGPDHALYAAGHAAVITADTAGERWTTVRRRADALYARVVGDVRPRLVGGFAFDDSPLADSPWRSFSMARFVLPAIQIVRNGSEAQLTVCFRPESRSPAEMVHRATRWLEPQLASGLGEGDDDPPCADPAGHPSHQDYRRRVADAVDAIGSGLLDKVVVARRSDIPLSKPPRVSSIFAHLGQRYPGCFRFVIATESSTLVGAPPELLIRKHDRRIASEALAGSIENGGGAAAALVGSSKDRAEHDLVVRAIADELGPLCGALSVPAEPSIRELRHLLHLQSRISGSLSSDHHVVDLVRRLHPTPAVGGTPRQLAQQWIASREPSPRGWYAAPVGWFDERGDGEFAVAIRSALLAGHRAHLYTGAGIVAASVPAAELDETRLKERGMLEALGVRV